MASSKPTLRRAMPARAARDPRRRASALMSRRSVSYDGSRKTIALDDGGMKLLSTAALVERAERLPVAGGRLAEQLPVAGGQLPRELDASTHVSPESGRSPDACDEPHRAPVTGNRQSLPRPPVTGNRQPLLLFRSNRPNLFAAGAD